MPRSIRRHLLFSMAQSAPHNKPQPETFLQRTLTSVLNELPVETALAAIFHREQGPLVAHAARGFTARDVQAILRTLSAPALADGSPSGDQDGRVMRMRLITPGAKSLLGAPLKYRSRTYGFLIIGHKESATFTKKERSLLDQAGEDISKALDREGLFNLNVVLSRPLVMSEPTAVVQPELFTAPESHLTPEIQSHITALLTEANEIVAFDRAWVCHYDPLAGNVEVLGMAGDVKSDQKDSKKDLRPGHRLALDSSAAGWAIRHRKPRVDHDLASTQGRFLDHKQLFKDRFQSSLVFPFFVRGQVGGTMTLASREAGRYQPTDARTLESLILKLADVLQAPPAPPAPPIQDSTSGSSATPSAAPAPVSLEPLIRKQERQAAIGEFSAFLATEVREPLGSIRAQLEEVTSEGILDFDPQTRVENAMRDLIRVEAILNEILDFAKPLELNRRLVRIPEVIESALTVVATDLEVTRIHVAKEYAPVLAPVRGDEAKLQQVFLSIFKNACEAMTPGGHLTIQVTQHRAGRGIEDHILIKNDGAPIPSEIVDKVFEPFFTTKKAGTGLGLATVKKIVEEHGGSIAIGSAPGEGTSVTIRLPGVSRGPAFRHRGRGRRPHRRGH
ncbi:MAG TPA: ATP-binding protein [Nitrospira sp.]|nr:ATP-binding protein [Nitrospira sp.]